MSAFLKHVAVTLLAMFAYTANAEQVAVANKHLDSRVELLAQFEEEGVVVHALIPKRKKGPMLLVSVARPDAFGFTDDILEKVLDVLSVDYRSGVSDEELLSQTQKSAKASESTVMCSLEVQSVGKNGLIGQGVEILCGTIGTFGSGKGSVTLRTVSTLSHDDFGAQLLKVDALVKEAYADALLLNRKQKR